MKKIIAFLGVVILIVLSYGMAATTVARAEEIAARLTGYEEVPVVSTGASGEFRAMISRDGQSIDYELTYAGLQGAVLQSHIHVAQRSVNGSIVIWLCETETHPAPVQVATQTPTCPQSGTVTGTITAAQVLASSATQQIGDGDLAEVIAAIRAGVTYVNVHTDLSPGGEIRGQIRASMRR